MISTRLKQFLDENGVGYDVMHHDPAFTAQELAARMHISGYEFVKVVVVKLDGNYALAAIPAPRLVNLRELAHVAGARKCSIAGEAELQELFPDCELGAMPPFGNLYNLPTYVDREVTPNENIVINAGTHAEAIRLRYSDFMRLARPRVGTFTVPPPVELAARKRAARKARKKKAKPRKKAKARKKAKPKKKAKRKKKAKARRKPRKKVRKKAKPKRKAKRKRKKAAGKRRKAKKARKSRKSGKRGKRKAKKARRRRR